MIIGRRGFLAGLGAVIAAPAIVRASVIMPVKPVLFTSEPKIITDLTFQVEGFAQITEDVDFTFADVNHPDPRCRTEQRLVLPNDVIAKFNGRWQFANHAHNNPVMATLRDGTELRRMSRLGRYV